MDASSGLSYILKANYYYRDDYREKVGKVLLVNILVSMLHSYTSLTTSTLCNNPATGRSLTRKIFKYRPPIPAI